MSICRNLCALLLFSALWVAAGSAIAQDGGSLPQVANEPQQPDDCVTQGANYHGVNPWVVRAIIKVESNFNSSVNKNKNGTVDVGIAQINSMHFKELNRYGITPSDLMNGCISSYVAAWHLHKQIQSYGNTWFAIGAYHSATPCYNTRYVALVWNTLVNWKAVQGGRIKGPSMPECDAISASKSKVQKRKANAETALAFDAD